MQYQYTVKQRGEEKKGMYKLGDIVRLYTKFTEQKRKRINQQTMRRTKIKSFERKRVKYL